MNSFYFLYFLALFVTLCVSTSAKKSYTITRDEYVSLKDEVESSVSVPITRFAVKRFVQDGNSLAPLVRRPQIAVVQRKWHPRMLFARYEHPPGTVQNPPGNLVVLAGGWVMRFFWVELGIPIQAASELLQAFFQQLLEWTEPLADVGDAMETISLKVYNLSLDFECESAVITWDFIRDFVARMLYATRRGFTGQFYAMLHHESTETMIKVGFRIITQQTPSESIGSN